MVAHSYIGQSRLENILEQTASKRTSTLTQGLASTASPPQGAPAPFALPASKMSQKERKRMQQAQQKGTAAISSATREQAGPSKPFSWQAVSAQHRTTLKDSALSAPDGSPGARSNSTPQMTMRQTVANPKTANRTVVPGASHSPAVPDRKQASPSIGPQRGGRGQGHAALAKTPTNSMPIPHSIRHQPVVEADWGLSISEIAAQQQIEKDIIKGAVAKRDLQEIQAEQEFQEWWNKESARVQAAQQEASAGAAKASRRNRARGGARNQGKKAVGEGSAPAEKGGR